MVWPRKCVVCGEFLQTDERYVCAECLADMPLTYFWTWRENPAERMLWGRTYLYGVVSLFYYSYDNDYKELLHQVKYGGDVALGRWLGEMLGRYMRDSYPFPEVIVPVPLHWRRKWRRGYNQAEVIARGLADGQWKPDCSGAGSTLCHRPGCTWETSGKMSREPSRSIRRPTWRLCVAGISFWWMMCLLPAPQPRPAGTRSV